MKKSVYKCIYIVNTDIKVKNLKWISYTYNKKKNFFAGINDDILITKCDVEKDVLECLLFLEQPPKRIRLYKYTKATKEEEKLYWRYYKAYKLMKK